MTETTPKITVLLVDNNDSFTYNLVDLLGSKIGVSVEVVRSDKIDLESVQHFSHIIFSPGPGLPQEQPAMFHILERYSTTKKIIGVCLGMQAVCLYFGASMYNLNTVYHGQQHLVRTFNHAPIFNGLSEIEVGLYHSWAIHEASLKMPLMPIAVSEKGILMGVRHEKYSIFGVQFHPESHLTKSGEQILRNFLEQ